MISPTNKEVAFVIYHAQGCQSVMCTVCAGHRHVGSQKGNECK